MSEPQNGRGALFAGGLAAILASACCLGPLVLIALGFSGAWIGNLTVLEPYRPIFIGAAQINDGGDAIGGGVAQLLRAGLAGGDQVRARLAQRCIAGVGVGDEQQREEQ